MNERRRAERKQDVNPVIIKLIHEERVVNGIITRLSLTENMSVCGFKIVTDEYILKDSFFEIELSLLWSFRTIHVTGKAVWVKGLTDTFYEMGVEIIDAPEESMKALSEHLATIED